MKKIEVLAPAGSMESLFAAVNNGADAVYLGGNKFSARAYASNFDNDNMIKAIDYAHSYGVAVYVTLNTILKETEIEEAVKYVGFLYDIGVDAIIIQDLGLFKRVKEEYPDFELHASTQMTIHNGEGALYFKDKGFHRIVLSRELSIDEIKYISKDLGIETEIFVHGALCISYSGQCLMSSMIGGRSGNRGRCAQPCRMEYTLKGETSGEKKAYLLSPKDICTIDDMEAIIKSGTTSLKLEGRMKRAEYVAGVVKNYRKSVDKVLYKEKFDVDKGKRELLQLFNRGGFSKAYLHKNTGKDMMSFNAPRNTGIPLGIVDDKLYVTIKENIALGDGVRYGEKGFQVNKIILNGNDVKEAKRGDCVKLFPTGYKKGEELYKSGDKELLDDLGLTTKPYIRKIPLSARVVFKVGENIKLLISHNGKSYEYNGEVVQKAEKKPLEKEKISENLKKSGEVPFKIEHIEYQNFEDGFLRVSDINNLRREALEDITKSITKSYRRRRGEKDYKNLTLIKDNKVEELFVCITKDQLNALLEMNVENIAIDIFNRHKASLKINDLIEASKKANIYIKTPNIIKDEFNKVEEIIDKVIPYVQGIVTNNVGIIRKYKDVKYIIGDYKLNIINSQSLKFYQGEINMPTISLEANRKEIKQMLKDNEGNVQAVIYGKPELMISEYCPIGSTFGEKTAKKDCNLACTRDTFRLVDRMKEEFSVMTDIFCRSYILNPVAMNLIAEREDLESLGVNSFRVEFRNESYEEVKSVVRMVRGEESYDSNNYTKGHYRRGVE